jgi:glycosyltransferase involved in cell wall biosynthesis
MRVGFMHYTGPPTIGGVEQTIAVHARILADLGHETVLLVGSGSSDGAGPTVRLVPRLGSQHPDVTAVKAKLDRGVVDADFHRLVDDIRQDLERSTEELEALVVHNVLSLHKNLALTAALWDRQQSHPWPRLIAWHHDLAWDRPEYAPELHPGDPWDLLRRPCPGAIHVTVSESQRQRLSNLIDVRNEDIRVIPPGVDPADFGRWGSATRRLYDDLDLDRADLILLFPTRVTRRKNIEMAIRIIAALREEGAGDARLLVTGPPGPHNPANRHYLDELLALAKELGVADRVRFLAAPGGTLAAPVDHRTLAELFTLADAALLTSRDEGFGIPILEAGLARLPVFCTDIPPFHESGMDDVTYLRLDLSPQLAAREILQTLRADRRFRLRRRVLGAYTWAKIVQDRLMPLLETRSR